MEAAVASGESAGLPLVMGSPILGGAASGEVQALEYDRSLLKNPSTMVGRILPAEIYRFRRSERMLHWSIALPFLVCLGTAAVLFFVYNKAPDRPYRDIFSLVHRYAGLALLALPLLAILLNPRDLRVHLANIREGWSWTLDDLKWLALSPLAILSPRVQLPEEGKFNAGEKLNFMASMGSYVVMGASGILLWRDPLFLGAWLGHLGTAAALVPLIAGHIFMATINPASRVGLSGMFSGWVRRDWAAHHYRRWYRQMVIRHLEYHGKVPELDTTGEHEIPAGSTSRPGLARLRWLVAGVTLGLAIATGVGAAAWALREHFPAVAGAARAAGLAQPQGEPEKLFVADEQPLLSRPIAEAPPVAGDLVRRGAQVTRMAQTGDFSLVQDQQGRAGYLRTSTLAASEPTVAAGVSFVDCAPALGETEPGPCEARAQAKVVACEASCPESRRAVCGELCREQLSTCLEACRGGQAPPREPAEASTAPVEPPTAVAPPVAPAVAPEGEPKAEPKVEPPPPPKAKATRPPGKRKSGSKRTKP